MPTVFTNKLRSIIRKVTPSLLVVVFLTIVLAFQTLACYLICDSRRVILIGCVFLVIFVAVYALYSRYRTRSQTAYLKVYLATICILGVFYLAVFTPGSVPDETYHYLEAYSLSNNLMFVSPPDSGLQMRECDMAFISNPSVHTSVIDASTYSSVLKEVSFVTSNTALANYDIPFAFDFASNPPQGRIAPALGILLARIFNLDAVLTYYLGRIFNLASFIALAFFSVKLIPIAKKCIMAISLLPMTLHMAASYSYDAFVIGVSLFFTAIMCTGIFSDETFSKKDIALASIAIFLLAPCKAIYVLLAVLVFAIPQSRFESRKSAIAAKAIIIGCAFVGLALFKIQIILGLLGLTSGSTALGVYAYNPHPDGVDFRGWGAAAETGHFFKFSFILSHPIETINLFTKSFGEMGDFYITTTWGGSLGWFQLEAPRYYGHIFLAILLLACIRTKDDNREIPGSLRTFFLVVFAVGVFASMLAMMLGWTFDDDTTILGVQGRYFLPFLMLLCMASRFKHIKCDVDLSFWCPYAFLASNLFYLTWIFAEIALL